MTYKQINGAREVRLWIGQILVPAATAATALLTIPGVREGISNSVKDKQNKIKSTFSRKKS